MRRTRAMGAAATMFAILAAAGCGGGSSGGGASSTASHSPKGIASGEPAPPQSSTASSSPASKSPTTKPTPKPSGTAAGAPGVPGSARQHTEDGAKAFAAYFYSRINLLYRKPGKDSIRGLYQESCKPCHDFEQDAAGMRKNKQHFVDDQLKYSVLDATPVLGTGYHVIFRLTQNSARLVDAGGKVVGKTPASTSKSVVLAQWNDGKGWIVQDLQSE